MTNDEFTGGPAFPMGYSPEGNSADHQGMTLRDYLAAHAPSCPYVEFEKKEKDVAEWAAEAAIWPWAYADAMLKERSK